MLTFCCIGSSSTFSEDLKGWFKKPPIPIQVRLIFDVHQPHEFLIADIRKHKLDVVVGSKLKRCVWIASHNNVAILHKALHEAVMGCPSSSCALLTNNYCPPILVWMAAIMQQCHNKMVDLDDISITKRVFGKVQQLASDILVILLSTDTVKVTDPLVKGHTVVVASSVDQCFDFEKTQATSFVIFRTACLADDALVSSLSLALKREEGRCCCSLCTSAAQSDDNERCAATSATLLCHEGSRQPDRRPTCTGLQ